jgi:hypothetical protein
MAFTSQLNKRQPREISLNPSKVPHNVRGKSIFGK